MRRPFAIYFRDRQGLRRWSRVFGSDAAEAKASGKLLLDQIEPGAKLLHLRRIDCATLGCEQPPHLGENPDTGKPERYCAACNRRADDQERQTKRRGPRFTTRAMRDRADVTGDEDDWREDR